MSTARALPAHVAFNQSSFSQLVNSQGGRVFRLLAGVAFLVIGYAERTHAAGIAAMAWSILPLSAGAFDVCWISALLGGPLSGARIRALRPSRSPTR
jgi:hypothetical protein